MKTIITSENIQKSFGEGSEKRNVLDDISLEIHDGEFVAVMGPSGSGKSTLMYALSGMDTVDAGQIHFEGTELGSLKENQLADLRRMRMGFIFQQPTLLKNLNILDNIILPGMRDASVNKAAIIKKARGLMQDAGISELETRNITQASGGQLQRVGICRALMGSPAIIFGDEPTGALNSKSANEILDLLLEIQRKGTTILLVTHDPKVAAKSERVLFMLDGKIVGQYNAGPYDASDGDLKAREEKLAAWLVDMKF